MADLRVLKLALLAETKDFVKGLDKATAESKTFSDKLGSALKTGALAFAALGAAAGAAAIKIGKDAVRAAIEDQQSQTQLARALKNTTNATEAQVKATEDYITATQNRYGTEDVKLRDSLGTLLRATQDVTEAQKLQTLALDISAATGKDLETVSLTLAKAYDGQLGALGRLGIPLDENIIKTKDFEAATQQLTDLFGGAAQANADTFAGKMEIIKRRVEDAQEAIGYALLPIMEKLSSFVGEKVVPAIEGLVRALTGGPRAVKGQTKETTSAFAELGIVFDENDQAGYNLGLALANLAGSFKDLFSEVDAGTAADGSFAKFINDIANIINAVSRFIDTMDRAIARIRDLNAAASRIPGLGGFGESQAVLAQTPQLSPGAAARLNPQVNINVRGAVDPQGTARTIVKTLNTAQRNTGVRITAPAAFGL